MSSEKQFKLPDARELAELQSNRQLYQSNLFRMELNELESILSVDILAFSVVEKLVSDLRDSIKSLKPKSIDGSILFSESYPFMAPTFKSTQTMAVSIVPPTSVELIGSSLFKGQMKGFVNVDLAAVMDSSMIDTREFVGYKYFDKRNVFVAHLYSHLESCIANLEESTGSKLKLNMSLTDWRGDIFKPIINITVFHSQIDSSAPLCVIRIFPALNPDKSFPHHRMSRDSCGARLVNPTSCDENEAPSAFYNCLVAEDMSFCSLSDQINKIAMKTNHFSAALRLLKTWANVRSLLGVRKEGENNTIVVSGLSGFELTAILAHVASSSVAASHAVPIQLFKLALSWFSSVSTESAFALPAPIGGANVLFRAQHLWQEIASLARVSLAHLDMRNPFDLLFGPATTRAPWADGSVWLPPQDKLSIAVFSKLESLNIIPETPSEALSFGAPAHYLHLSAATLVLKKALTDRVTAMSGRLLASESISTLPVPLVPKALFEWSPLYPLPSCKKSTLSKSKKSGSNITSQFAMTPFITFKAGKSAAVHRQLERGHSVGTAEADAFRIFWGDRVQMRRFRDGVVAEAVMFDSQPVPERCLEPSVDLSDPLKHRVTAHAVPDIINYILNLHLNIKSGNNANSNNVRIQFAPLGMHAAPSSVHVATHKEYQEFAQRLKDLDDLPLSIKDVHHCGAALRYTAAVLPRASVLRIADKPSTSGGGVDSLLDSLDKAGLLQEYDNDNLGPQDIVVEFNHSPNWPTDREAIEALKTSLLIRLAKVLTAGGFEEPQVSKMGFMDVRYVRTIYRVRIVCPSELVGNAVAASNMTAPAALRPHRAVLNPLRDLWWKPTIASRLHAAVLANPALGGGIRLLKIWAAAHLIDPSADWALELVAAHAVMARTRVANEINDKKGIAAETRQVIDETATGDAITDEATTAQAAFLQALELLATHDFDLSPLWINLDAENSFSQVSSLTGLDGNTAQSGISEEVAQEALKEHRQADLPIGVAPSWFCLPSRFDPLALLCPMPTTSVARRLVALAKESIAKVRSLQITTESDSMNTTAQWVKLMFTPSWSSLDAVLALDCASGASSGKKMHKESYANLRQPGKLFTDVNDKTTSNGIIIDGPVNSSDLPTTAAFAGWMAQSKQQLGGAIEILYNHLSRPVPSFVGVSFRKETAQLKAVSVSVESHPSIAVSTLKGDIGIFDAQFADETLEEPNKKRRKAAINTQQGDATGKLVVPNAPVIMAHLVASSGPLVTDMQLFM